MAKRSILKLLSRSDKWYIGGGNRLVWTPPFPIWLDVPGFWDKAHYYNRELEPIFTWTILDEEGNEISLKKKSRTWNPAKLISNYEPSEPKNTREGKGKERQTKRIHIREEKCCLPSDVLASIVFIKNPSNKKRVLHFIAWTIQPNYPSKKTTWLDGVVVQKDMIVFTKHLQPHHQAASPLPVQCTLGLSRVATSYGVNLSEGSVIQPHWHLTPFVEKFKNGMLPNERNLTGVTQEGLIYIALHATIELRAGCEEQISVFYAAAPTIEESKHNITSALLHDNPAAESEKSWNEYFVNLPYFECSDEYLTRYYWYRWYGLKLLTMNLKEGNYRHPFVCEGIGYFRAPISYSAMCHILENRWLSNPALAQGSLLTFIEHQRKDGGFRGYIDADFFRQEMFYHANWGKSLIELCMLHPEKKFLKKAYEGLARYAEYFDRERDGEQSGLYDIDNHYETGQEYMHRYLAVNPDADKDNWGEIFQLKGVDVTVYMYELKKALSVAAGLLGDKHAEKKWSKGANEIKSAIVKKMWDSNEGMFFDINPRTGKRTLVKAATCFYPYMTDIVAETHLTGFKRHLFNPNEFWTEFPVPSSSADDRYFNPEAEWKGKRMNCPWNGRVWPMTNSHIAEALAQTAIQFNDRKLKMQAVEFMMKFIRMMFFHGDPKLPNCFEHYNPYTGEASTYRGVDDYQHSWIVDLIIKYVCGIRVNLNEIVIDPFPFPVTSFILDNIKVRNHLLRIERSKNNFSVYVDGKKIKKSIIGKSVTLLNLLTV